MRRRAPAPPTAFAHGACSAAALLLVAFTLGAATRGPIPYHGTSFVHLETAASAWPLPNNASAVSALPQPATAACRDLWAEKLRLHAAVAAAQGAALASPGAGAKFTGITAYDPYEPSWPCHLEQRVGGAFGDGGKFICAGLDYFTPRTGGCLVYSVGSNGDFSFERDVIKRFGCEVHTFDPTGNTARFRQLAQAAGVHFHPWGLHGASGATAGAVSAAEPTYLLLGEIVEALGHRGRQIHILKVDCEGCEHAAFAPVWRDLAAGAYAVGQIAVEVHAVGMVNVKVNGTEFESTRAFFAGAAAAGFRIFHKERNHWGCDGYKCVEFSLISEAAALEIFRHAHRC